MKYREAVEYLAAETTEGIKPDLSRITMLCDLLGEPQFAFPVIHITGTNGKTSTARMISSIMQAGWLYAGVYTSPHLVSYTERVTVNGVPMPEQAFADELELLIPLMEQVSETTGSAVTQFEALTALAFSYLSKQELDVAIIEVGMGGSWDATNVVMADVAVVTNVALEHTDRLGTTVEAIANEKSGIIKPGCDVVTAADQPSVLSIIKERAAEVDADLYTYGNDVFIGSEEKLAGGGHEFSLKGILGMYEDIQLHLIGGHQMINAALATAASELFLKRRRPDLLEGLGEMVREGLANAESPGRLEVAGERPLLVLDGAHNPAGAFRLAEALKEDFDYDRLVLVLAVLADKDVDGIVSALVPQAGAVIVTQADAERALPAADLERIVTKHTSAQVSTSSSVAMAIEKAKTLAKPDDLIVVTGSLYTIGEAKQAL